MPDNLYAMTSEQLLVLQEDYEQQRLALREKAREVAEARRKIAAIEPAALYGLTPHESREVTRIAADSADENALPKALARTRKGKMLQMARAGIAELAAGARDAG